MEKYYEPFIQYKIWWPSNTSVFRYLREATKGYMGAIFVLYFCLCIFPPRYLREATKSYPSAICLLYFFFVFVSLWHGFSWMYIIGSNINLAFDKRKSRYNVYFVYLQKLDIDISNIVLLLFFCWRVIFLNIYNIYFRFKYTYLIWESLDTMYMYTCIFTDIDI